METVIDKYFITPPPELQGQFITISQFAKLLGISRQHVYNLIKRYKIKVLKCANLSLIERKVATMFYPRLHGEHIKVKMHGSEK